MKDLELFIFNKNLVFETVYYKGMLKILLLFEVFLCLYQFQMKGWFIIHVVNIAGNRIIEDGINGISRGKNFLGILIGVEPLKFVPLDVGVVLISPGLETWMRS